MLTEIEIFQKVNQKANKRKGYVSLADERRQAAWNAWNNYDFHPYTIGDFGDWTSAADSVIERTIDYRPIRHPYTGLKPTFRVVFKLESAEIYGVFVYIDGNYMYQFDGSWQRWRGYRDYEQVTRIDYDYTSKCFERQSLELEQEGG